MALRADAKKMLENNVHFKVPSKECLKKHFYSTIGIKSLIHLDSSKSILYEYYKKK